MAIEDEMESLEHFKNTADEKIGPQCVELCTYSGALTFLRSRPFQREHCA